MRITRCLLAAALGVCFGLPAAAQYIDLVPGIEYRVSDAADLVGEIGIGLNDNSFTYAGIGVAFYLR
jgi:hypothetical protein